MSKAGKKRNRARDEQRGLSAVGLLPNGASMRLSVQTPGIYWVTCTCGCERQYPYAWVEELVPFVARLVGEGKGRTIPTLTNAGYMAPDGGFAAEGAFFQPNTGGPIYLLHGDCCPTLTRAARTWDRSDMDSLADLMVDATAAAVAISGLEQEVY